MRRLERAGHGVMDQCHPLGVVGRIVLAPMMNRTWLHSNRFWAPQPKQSRLPWPAGAIPLMERIFRPMRKVSAAPPRLHSLSDRAGAGGWRRKMQFFLRCLIVACLGLVTWWRLETGPGGHQFVTIVILGLAGIAALLVSKRQRVGLWLSMWLGSAHLAGTLLTIPLTQMRLVLPFVAWCSLAIAGSAILLVATRERHSRRPVYERYPEF